MAYVLNALIADLELLQGAGHLAVVPLAQGKGLVPLGDEYWRKGGYSSQPICREWEARTTGDDEFENIEERQHCIDKAATAFAWMAAQCAQLCSAPSATLAYVEAEYFGGAGTQAVAVWEGGHLVFGPVVSDKAIDHALARIGVKAWIRDEFDELQLGRCRMTSDWLALT